MSPVLVFPVPITRLGQFELFPEPVPPDPHDASALVLHYTALQIRWAKIADDLSPEERMRAFADYYANLMIVEKCEARVQHTKQRDEALRIQRITA